MIIGIVGFINSGKGTVGDILVSRYGYTKDSFANPLKDAVSIIFGWNREMLEGQTDSSRNWREQIDPYWTNVIGQEMTPRLALQLFGTECIREVFHSNVWSASLIKRYREIGRDVVVADCRFRNEIQAIKDAGGKVIRVKRGLEPEWYNAMVEYNSGNVSNALDKKVQDWIESGYIPHVSETDWIGSDFDYTILNDDTLETLNLITSEVMSLLRMDNNMDTVIDYFGG